VTRRLEVLHRPRHSPADTIFHDADRRTLIAADHLLPHSSPNPLISRPLDGSTERPHSLEIYMDSLRLTRAMDLDDAPRKRPGSLLQLRRFPCQTPIRGSLRTKRRQHLPSESHS